jgi:hypothetical protein
MTTSEKRKETLRKSQHLSREEKKNSGMKQISFYLDEAILESLKAECKSKGVSYAQFITRALENTPDKVVKQQSNALQLDGEQHRLKDNLTNTLFSMEEQLDSIKQHGTLIEIQKIEETLLSSIKECEMVYDLIRDDLMDIAFGDNIKPYFDISFETWIKEVILDICSNTSISRELEQLLAHSNIKLYQYYYEKKLIDCLKYDFEW